jgi:hypothetical protein
MPRRRRSDPLPRYSFVFVETKGNDATGHRAHSSSVRGHAAYWGGPGKLRSDHAKSTFTQHDDTGAIGPNADKGGGSAAQQPSTEKYLIPI